MPTVERERDVGEQGRAPPPQQHPALQDRDARGGEPGTLSAGGPGVGPIFPPHLANLRRHEGAPNAEFSEISPSCSFN